MKEYPSVPQGDYYDEGLYGSMVQRSVPVFSTLGKGPKGDTGEKGDKGDKGDRGLTGATGPKGEVGPQGTPGRNLEWSSLTDAQKQELYGNAAKGMVASGNKVEQATFTTSLESTRIIPIPIKDWDAFDMLFVDVEGLDLVEGEDYQIQGDSIRLASPIEHSGTKVNFKAIKLVLPAGEKKIINAILPAVYATADSLSLPRPKVTAGLDEDGSVYFQFSGLKGEQGLKGDKGDKGDSGSSVASITYAVSELDVRPADNLFKLTSYPKDVTPGMWVWTKTEYTDGSKTYNFSRYSIDGKNGSPAIVSQVIPTNEGHKVTLTDGAGQVWSFDVANGGDGPKGEKGEDGYSTHTAWAQDVKFATDGSPIEVTDFTIVNQGLVPYDWMGVYTEKRGDDPDNDSLDFKHYTWSYIKGDIGKHEVRRVSRWCPSVTNQTPPSDNAGWSLFPPSPTSTMPYIWRYDTVTYSDGTELVEEKYVASAMGPKGEKGDKGEDGIDVESSYLDWSNSLGLIVGKLLRNNVQGRIRIDGNYVYVEDSSGNEMGHFGADVLLGRSTGTHVTIKAGTGLTLWNGTESDSNNLVVQFGANGMRGITYIARGSKTVTVKGGKKTEAIDFMWKDMKKANGNALNSNYRPYAVCRISTNHSYHVKISGFDVNPSAQNDPANVPMIKVRLTANGSDKESLSTAVTVEVLMIRTSLDDGSVSDPSETDED